MVKMVRNFYLHSRACTRAHTDLVILFTVVAGTVVLWRMQPVPGDSASDLTDGHVIMRHIPHMSDVKDVR